MSEENNKVENIIQKFIDFSQKLDLETTSISENKLEIRIYFKNTKKPCFSFEQEVKISYDKFYKKFSFLIYRDIKIEGENDSLLKKYYLLEMIFSTSIKLDIRTIKIQNFPINKNDLNEYLNNYNKSYQKRLKTQKEVFSSENDLLQSGVYQLKIVTRNHYIPQGYLRKFECEDKPGYIYNFKIDEVKLYEPSGNDPLKIESILYLKYFYSLDIELRLKEIEDSFYDIRDRIMLKKSIKWIGDEEKLTIVKYIFAQYLRTSLERNRFIGQYIATLKTLFLNQNSEKIDIDKLKIDFNELKIRLDFEKGMYQFLYPSSKDNQQRMLFDFYLKKNKWKLISAEHMDFYTSDNPIVLYNEYERKFNQDDIETVKKTNEKNYGMERPHGLMEQGIQLYFPITPRLCILIYDSHLSQKLLNPVDINKQILFQCYQSILSSNNHIGNFLKRNLKQSKEKRAEFVDLHINVQIKEF